MIAASFFTGRVISPGSSTSASYAEFKVGGREHYVAAFRLNKHIVQNRHLRFRAYDVCDLFEACREVFLADFKLHNGVSVLPGGR